MYIFIHTDVSEATVTHFRNIDDNNKWYPNTIDKTVFISLRIYVNMYEYICTNIYTNIYEYIRIKVNKSFYIWIDCLYSSLKYNTIYRCYPIIALPFIYWSSCELFSPWFDEFLFRFVWKNWMKFVYLYVVFVCFQLFSIKLPNFGVDSNIFRYFSFIVLFFYFGIHWNICVIFLKLAKSML